MPTTEDITIPKVSEMVQNLIDMSAIILEKLQTLKTKEGALPSQQDMEKNLNEAEKKKNEDLKKEIAAQKLKTKKYKVSDV